jgi:hypothetical protein
MARGRRCPPGIFCISDELITIIIVLIAVALLFFLYAIFFLGSGANKGPTIIMPGQPPNQTTVIPIKGGGDSRYDMAPEPLRDWSYMRSISAMPLPQMPLHTMPLNAMPLAPIPINIPTQGLPESFQSVGVIQVDDKVLPLYGRRTGRGSDRWNYYTRTDTYNPVPIPVNFQKRKCMDDVGCQEILSGDDVKIEVLNKQGKTSIYDYGGPKYIPGII